MIDHYDNVCFLKKISQQRTGDVYRAIALSRSNTYEQARACYRESM